MICLKLVKIKFIEYLDILQWFKLQRNLINDSIKYWISIQSKMGQSFMVHKKKTRKMYNIFRCMLMRFNRLTALRFFLCFFYLFFPPLQNHLISNDKWLQKWNHAMCAKRSSFISVRSLVRYIIHSTRYQMLKQNDHTLHEIQLQNVSPTM